MGMIYCELYSVERIKKLNIYIIFQLDEGIID